MRCGPSGSPPAASLASISDGLSNNSLIAPPPKTTAIAGAAGATDLSADHFCGLFGRIRTCRLMVGVLIPSLRKTVATLRGEECQGSLLADPVWQTFGLR